MVIQLLEHICQVQPHCVLRSEVFNNVHLMNRGDVYKMISDLISGILVAAFFIVPMILSSIKDTMNHK